MGKLEHHKRFKLLVDLINSHLQMFNLLVLLIKKQDYTWKTWQVKVTPKNHLSKK